MIDVFGSPAVPFQIASSKSLCSLWKGYGQIIEVKAVDAVNGAKRTLIVKEIGIHRDLEGGESHLRKIRSYKVEAEFYARYSATLNEKGIRVPELIHVEDCVDIEKQCGTLHIVISDLRDKTSYKAKKFSFEETKAVLRWLARFHAVNFRKVPPFANGNRNQVRGDDHNLSREKAHGILDKRSHSSEVGQTSGLWQEGSFWQLGTRLEELENVEDEWVDLKIHAYDIHRAMVESPYRTIIHGDSKAANFFLYDGTSAGHGLEAAAFDFQYVGQGDPMRDVSYLLASSVEHHILPKHEDELLTFYYSELLKHVDEERRSGYTYEVMKEYLLLSLADFVRFQAGWGWWGNIHWSSQKVREYLQKLSS